MGLSLFVFVAFDGAPAYRGQILAALACCTFTFIYLFLPETAGLSLENVATWSTIPIVPRSCTRAPRVSASTRCFPA
jgi:hypothetical protein